MAVIESSSSSTSQSPSIDSSQPPVDRQSSDSINDQLNSLSLQPENESKIDTDNDGGERDDGGNSEERENEEKRENEVEIVSQSENENENENENDGNGVENGNENGKKERERSRKFRFPVRPDAEDCSFYLRTGLCKFGINCKFNHPPNRKNQGKEVSADRASQKVNETDDSLDKEGKIDCKYFDRPGGCKFGKACKYNHSRKSSPTLELNFLGLPIRLGEKECPYYMRNGSCKYGANCRFNHPDPTSLGGPDAPSVFSNGGSVLSSNASQSTPAPWSPPAALNESPPFVPLMFRPTQGVPSRPEWNAYRATVYPTERSVQVPPAYAMSSQLLERNVYAHQQEQTFVDEFPERPGQPECSYFLKTGNCKYRSACKFHHPKSAIAKSPSFLLSDLGLPLRPGESVCSYYNRYGICKYGPACKYDHPVNYAHSASLAVSAVNQTAVLANSLVSRGAMAAGS